MLISLLLGELLFGFVERDQRLETGTGRGTLKILNRDWLSIEIFSSLYKCYWCSRSTFIDQWFTSLFRVENKCVSILSSSEMTHQLQKTFIQNTLKIDKCKVIQAMIIDADIFSDSFLPWYRRLKAEHSSRQSQLFWACSCQTWQLRTKIEQIVTFWLGEYILQMISKLWW